MGWVRDKGSGSLSSGLGVHTRWARDKGSGSLLLGGGTHGVVKR